MGFEATEKADQASGVGAPASDIVCVRGYAIASTIQIADFVKRLSGDGHVVHHRKTHATIELGRSEYAVVHDFGAIVFFGGTDAARKRLTDTLLSLVPNETRPLAVEDFIVEVNSSKKSTAGFDRVLLRELSLGAVDLVALVVGQSVAMEYFEDDVDRMLIRIDAIASDLAASGRSKGNVRELTRLIGAGMVLRNRVVHTLALLDAPLMTWDDETLDRIYRELRLSFAIDERYRALDQKLSMIRDNVELIVDLVGQKRSLWLEVAVVGLILLELLLALLK